LVRLDALVAAADGAAGHFAAPVRLTLIGPDALEAFQQQWDGHAERRYPWPWPDMIANARRNEPGRFEVAIWSDAVLCGLSLGGTRADFCRVDYIEGSPDPLHPLKGSVTVIASGAAIAYATALGKAEIRLMNPLPAVVPYYERLGFQLVSPHGGAPYCRIEVP
jgi:hypothetical protein